MADTDVSPADVQEAARFMQSFLLTKIPDGDFTEGSPLYDHTIQGFAFIFAYLRKQIGIVRARQSLLTLVNLPVEESVDDATDAILGNLLLYRSAGKLARGPGTIHLSQRSDLLIPVSTRFFKTNAHVFLIEATDDLFIPASDLRPVSGPDGRTTSWVTPTLPLVAVRSGKDYNLAAGPFVSFTRFHPYVTQVENVADFTGGDGTQSTSNFVENARTALSLRALLNPGSNSAVLRPRFDIEQVTTITTGAPEMNRDLVTEIGTGISLHVGGHMDIYVRRAVRQTTERLQVGGAVNRADDRTVRLHWVDGGPLNFLTGAGITAPVEPGDVLSVTAGLPEAPFQFKVTRVEPQALVVSSRLPFSQATDELPTQPALGLSVGNNYSRFDNKVPLTLSAGYRTTSQISRSGGVILSGVPVYRIKRVEVVGAVAAALEVYKDPTTDTIVFTRRENTLPVAVPVPGDTLTFTVDTIEPSEAQSGIGITIVSLGWPGAHFDGYTVEVTYDTVSNFSAIDAFVRNEYERPGCASTLAKGFHPIYVSFTIPYRLPPIRRDTLGEQFVAFNESIAARYLEEYVSSYRGLGGLDQSLVATEARSAAGVEVSIFPFTIQYELLGPDGKVYRFETEDVVTLDPDEQTSRLRNPSDFGLPSVGYAAALRKRLRNFGVSDRTTRYLIAPGTVTFLRRS